MPFEQRHTVLVRGLKETIRSFDKLVPELDRELRSELQEAGELVRREAAQRFAGTSRKTAAGFEVRVRQKGVSVAQRLRKTTGKRPDYGAKQMRDALLPALAHQEGAIEQRLEGMLDRLTRDEGF